MRLIKEIRNSTFLKQNAILFFGGLVVSVLNYLYYPILGRLLNLTEYGEVQILISLYLQLAIFLTVMGQVTVNIVSNTEDIKKRDYLLGELQRFTFLLLLGFFVLGLSLGWWVASILQFESPLPIIVLFASIFATAPFTFQTAYLRGRQLFGYTSMANVITAIGRIVFSVLFVVAGWSTAGAVGGVAASQLVGAIFAYKAVRRNLELSSVSRSIWRLPDMKLLWPELRFAGFVLIASLGVTVLSSIDTVIVKIFFDPETAGGYAGIATVAKIIFFLTGSIAQVMLPAVKMHGVRSNNRSLLLKSFVLLSAAGGSALLFFALFPDFVIITLMGKSFAPYAHILPTLSAALFLVSIINLIVSYYVALRQFNVAYVVSVGVIFTIILLTTQHSTLESVAVNLLYGSVVMLASFIAWRAGYELYHTRKSS